MMGSAFRIEPLTRQGWRDLEDLFAPERSAISGDVCATEMACALTPLEL